MRCATACRVPYCSWVGSPNFRTATILPASCQGLVVVVGKGAPQSALEYPSRAPPRSSRAFWYSLDSCRNLLTVDYLNPQQVSSLDQPLSRSPPTLQPALLSTPCTGCFSNILLCIRVLGNPRKGHLLDCPKLLALAASVTTYPLKSSREREGRMFAVLTPTNLPYLVV